MPNRASRTLSCPVRCATRLVAAQDDFEVLIYGLTCSFCPSPIRREQVHALSKQKSQLDVAFPLSLTLDLTDQAQEKKGDS